MIERLMERPEIDWAKPVQWNTGEAATAERVSGFILITIGDVYPAAINRIMQRKHFQDTVVVHEDTGVPVVGLGEYAPDAWIENVDPVRHPLHSIFATF